jgi:hypothetical protein
MASTLRPRNLLVTLILSSLPFSAHAGKVEFSAGAYSFTANNKTNRTTKTLSGVGSYRLAYHMPVRDRFEFDLGYSLLATQTIGGDLAFGFDLGINYFPFSPLGEIRAESGTTHALFQPLWRPFVGISFNQRNFQSTSSQYAGGGAKVGTEYQWNSNFSVSGALRYIGLNGPNSSTATQIDLLGGVNVQF